MKYRYPKFLADLDPNIYFSNNYVVLDFETDTAHGDFGNPIHPANQLLLVAYRLGSSHPDYRGGRTYSHWGSEFDQARLLEAVQKADFIVAHHSKYELGWLRRIGLDLRKVLPFDTMLAEYVLLGNRAAGDEMMKGLSISLDMACRRRGLPIKDPVVDLMIKNGINPSRIPSSWLEGRCKQDVETTEAVFLSQREQLRESNRLPVLYTRCLLTPLLAAIEPEGMALDPAKVEAEYHRLVAELGDLNRQMAAMTQICKNGNCASINWRSQKQVAEYLYDVLKFSELRKWDGTPKRTKPSKGAPEGKRKTDKKTLELLEKTARTDAQKEFVELRRKLGKVNAALTKNIEFFMGVIAEYGGVFYGEFNQANTATNRLSSSGIAMQFQMFKDKTGKKLKKKKVQFQNMPRIYKSLLRAKRDGYLMGDFDGSQLEFRVAAFLGRDGQAFIDISNPAWDAHITSASYMVGKTYEELYAAWKAKEAWADEARTNAKPETFKPLYGGEFGTEVQMRWYQGFKERYVGIAHEQEKWAKEVGRTKQLITPWGLRFYWPFAKWDRSGRLNVKTSVYNYPVQALATAEIIPIALVYFWHGLQVRGLSDYCHLVNTVHDSVATEIHPDAVTEVTELAKDSFTTKVYGYLKKVYKLDFNVPLGIGIKIGTHWGTGDESSFNIWPDGREERVK